MVAEEAALDLDLAEAVEVDRDPVVGAATVGLDGDDDADGAVANVGGGLARWVQAAVRTAGDDSVADGEPTAARRSHLQLVDFALHLEEAVGEPVEDTPGAVALGDHRVVLSSLACLPPVLEEGDVEVDLAGDGLQVSGGVEVAERFVDAAFTESGGDPGLLGEPEEALEVAVGTAVPSSTTSTVRASRGERAESS